MDELTLKEKIEVFKLIHKFKHFKVEDFIKDYNKVVEVLTTTQTI